MAKIHIQKSGKAIKKEERKARVEQVEKKKSVTNDELKELILMLLEK